MNYRNAIELLGCRIVVQDGKHPENKGYINYKKYLNLSERFLSLYTKTTDHHRFGCLRYDLDICENQGTI